MYFALRFTMQASVINRTARNLGEPGKYYFWKNGVTVSTVSYPSCLVQKEIVGQEILTADKVHHQPFIRPSSSLIRPHRP